LTVFLCSRIYNIATINYYCIWEFASAAIKLMTGPCH
jgi:hypothetical protein